MGFSGCLHPSRYRRDLGFAVAGGLELALWCDLRIVKEGATLGYSERRWGVARSMAGPSDCQGSSGCGGRWT